MDVTLSHNLNQYGSNVFNARTELVLVLNCCGPSHVRELE